MKNLRQLLLVGAFLGSFACAFQSSFAQHFVVYGFVLNSQSGEPVAGQRIVIKSDTNEQYYNFCDTLTTNFEGYFIDTIFYPYDHYTPFEVFTHDCFGTVHLYKFSAPIPQNPYYFTVCTGMPMTCFANYSYTLNPSVSLAVDFNNLSYNAEDYFWDFGDQTFSNQKNPVKVYTNPGTYAVKLKIHDQFHICEDSIVKYINVSNVLCNAAFTYSQNPYNPLEVQFTDHSSGGVNYYYWDFGDGTGSALRHPFKQYNTPGNYKVVLQVFDSQPVFNTSDSADALISYVQSDYLNFGGQVFEGLFPINYGYSELYRQEGSSFVFESSTTANETGVYYYFKKFKGNYLVRSHDVFVSGSTQTLPGYYGNKLFWQDVNPLYLTQSAFNFDITLPSTNPYPTGTCGIEGFISKNVNGNLVPASNITLFLLTTDKQPYTVVYSDSEGHFAFPSVEFGTYLVYPEIPGIWTTPFTVVLDENKPNVKNVFFVLENSTVASVDDTPETRFDDIQLYPNPATTEATLLLIPSQQSVSRIVVTDLSSRVIYQVEEKVNNQQHKLAIPLESWEPGTYFVSVSSQGIPVKSLKLIKIN
jgi:PKD repeat protein